MAQQVKVKDAEGNIGAVPVRALPYYEGKGYEALDKDEVKAARDAEGITPEDALKASEDLAEALDGTAADSAEEKKSGKS